eukprot:778013-Pleurochrysis_carterae.AAC.1
MRDPPSLRLLRSCEARREHMDDTLATMTPSARLAPVHALSDAQPDVSDPASGIPRAAPPNSPRRLRRHDRDPRRTCVVRYDGNVVYIGNDKFFINALRHKIWQRRLPAGGPLA